MPRIVRRLTRYSAFGDPNDARLVFVSDADSKLTRYGYDAFGNLTRVNGPNATGAVGSLPERLWAYEHRNYLQSEQQPEKGITTYLTDPAGNVLQIADNAGTTLLHYDGNNRLWKRDAPGTADDLEIHYRTDGQVDDAGDPRRHRLRGAPAGPAGHLRRRHGRDVPWRCGGAVPPRSGHRRTRGSGALSACFLGQDMSMLEATATSGWTASCALAARWCCPRRAWGASVVLAGLTTVPALVLLGLVLAGAFGHMISGLFRGTIWHQTIPDSHRGRLGRDRDAVRTRWARSTGRHAPGWWRRLPGRGADGDRQRRGAVRGRGGCHRGGPAALVLELRRADGRARGAGARGAGSAGAAGAAGRRPVVSMVALLRSECSEAAVCRCRRASGGRCERA